MQRKTCTKCEKSGENQHRKDISNNKKGNVNKAMVRNSYCMNRDVSGLGTVNFFFNKTISNYIKISILISGIYFIFEFIFFL